jgi:hypothetical protein
MKKTFTIPDGCKAFTVEQTDSKVVVIFEPEVKERWRAKPWADYYTIIGDFSVQLTCDSRHLKDDTRYIYGNYFKTREEAEEFAEYMKECTLKFHAK